MRNRFVPAVIAFAAVVLVGVAAFFVWKTYPWIFSARYTIRVATGPLGGDAAKFVAAFKREVAQERPRVQLTIVETADLAASAAALKSDDVDLAVARSDDPNAADGNTIFIMRKIYAAFLVSGHSSVDDVSDLNGKKIGVLSANTSIDPLARTVIDFYGFDEKNILLLTPQQLAEAIQGKHIAALLVVGPVGPGPVADAIQAFRKLTKKAPKLLELAKAEAIVERSPVYEKIDIPDGAFGGAPSVPKDDTTTIAARILLIAKPTMSRYAAGELTRLLLVTKSKLAATLPMASQLAAPSTDRDVVLPAHPGTIAFLNGDQPDILDESLTYIYLASILTGVFGSLAAWLTSLRNRRKLRDLQGRIERLPALLGEARAATPAPERLAATEEELDRMTEWFVEKFVADEISPEIFGNATSRVSHIRALIQKRRAALKTTEGDGGSGAG